MRKRSLPPSSDLQTSLRKSVSIEKMEPTQTEHTYDSDPGGTSGKARN
jgi:hypothetical protein